jgi:hypothetical protein
MNLIKDDMNAARLALVETMSLKAVAVGESRSLIDH